MKQIFQTILCICVSCVLTAQPSTPAISYIKVDQFGYREDASKVAVISDPQVGFNDVLGFTPGATYELRDWFTDAVVYSSTIQQWNGGAVHDQSGDAGWWFDFSSISVVGEYYIFDPTNNVRSHRFIIDDDVYTHVLKSAMRVFFYNRCGIAKQNPYAQSPWTDATSFTQDIQARDVFDKSNASLEKDLSGGWYDAGDFNKYITFAESTMHDLLWAYTENPSLFTDNWDIPESGNGLPDIIDELKWELDWFMKMNNPDGSTHLKMGSQNYSDNTQTPPSLNTDTRYYGPTCSSAEIVTAGVFAQAALVFEQFPALSAYAQDMEARAETTWAYVLPKITANNLDTTCDQGEIISGDADVDANLQLYSALKAAIYLYDLTGKATYQTYISNNLGSTEQVGNGYWFAYSRGLNDALLHYTTLPGVSTTEINLIRNSFADYVTRFIPPPDPDSVDNTVLFGMSTIDLYRSYMPNNQYHWGSNKIKGTFGQTSLLLEKYNIVPANNASYVAKAEEHVHYFHGLNPMGYTYLTNMCHLGAENSVNQMYHQWFGDNSDWDDARTSLYGPAPGYVTGGPNVFTSVPLAPPFGQPQQKSYLDFNTSSTAAPSWEISEPAIYYQASYVRLLAAFSSAPGSCLASGTSCDDGDPKTTGDVEDGFCGCKGDCPAIGTPCDDGDPLTNNDEENGACLCEGIFGEDPTTPNCEVITNGSFDTDASSWFSWGTTTITQNNGEVSLTNNSGANPWDCAFAQNPVSYTGGASYTLTFNASASANRIVTIKLGLGDADQTAILYTTVNLTQTMAAFSIPFTNALSSTTIGTVEFQLGGDTADVTLDDVSVTEDGCSNCPNGEVELLTNGTFDTDISNWAYWGCTPQQVSGEAHILSIIQGAAEWDAGFANQNVTYQTGRTYQISFDASADVNRDMFLKVSTLGGATTYIYEQIPVTTTMSNYSFSFAMTDPSVTNGTVEFFVGNDTANLYIDDVSVTDGNCNPTGSCEQVLYVGSPISAIEYEAELELSSDALIVAPNDVEFHAGDFVELMENFEVQIGAAFHAHIASCN